METAENTLTTIIRGIIALVIVCVFGALIVFNPIVGGTIGGALGIADVQDRAVQEANERDFHVVCVRYKDATKWERWSTPEFWTLGWCENYIDRM